MDFQLITCISFISAIASALIAEKRGGVPLAWFFLGAVFGPLAVIVALTAGKKCNTCLSIIPKEASKCRHCGEQFN